MSSTPINPQYVSHENMESMANKSEVFFVDILMKNKAVHADMVDIMEYMQDRLGEEFSTCKMLSEGDQLTCVAPRLSRQQEVSTSFIFRLIFTAVHTLFILYNDIIIT